MTWKRGLMGLVVIAAVCWFALQPEKESPYLGDFPSQYDSTIEAFPRVPGSPVAPPAGDQPAPVPAAPAPADVPPAPAQGPPGPQPLSPLPAPSPGPAFRPSEAGPDTSTELPLGLGSSVSGLTPGSPEYQEQLSRIREVPACADLVVRPDGSAFSCLTGALLGVFDLPVTPPIP